MGTGKKPKSKARATVRIADDEESPLVEMVLTRIREVRSFDFRNYKRATLTRRIERRMMDRRCASLREYLRLLEREPTEFDALISSMLIKVTSFFRDSETWEALMKKVIPQVLSEKRAGEEIRVWCAGCATGEEAFSVAMYMAESMGPAFAKHDVKVFGTDLDEKAVAFARRAIYSSQQIASLPKALIARYFVEEAGGWSVKKEIRRRVVFGVNNLVSDAPISRLDLLLCRNVFIYLDAALQRRVLTRFHYALKRNGVLVLGKSEMIQFAAKLFEPVDTARRIYRKDGRRDLGGAQERPLGLLGDEPLAIDEAQGQRAPILIEEFHRDVLQSLRAPIIVTALDGTVTLWNAQAALLWGRSEAEVIGKKLTALNLSGLPGNLLIEKTGAVREGKSARETAEGTVARRGESRPVQITIELTPLRSAGDEATGLIYTVSEVTRQRDLEAEIHRMNEERQSALEELQTTNEELQSSNEELETTNEELQSANEELQTTNEELQSTNEELETTNEELQSTNAELDATNRELAARTDEINLSAFCQRTIIRSLAAGVVVLDARGRVTMWNLAAERLLGLAESEAMGQSLWTLHIPALNRAVIQRARKSLNQNLAHRADSVEYDLPAGGRGTATVAAVPILDGGVNLGAVIIFEDRTREAVLEGRLTERPKKGSKDRD